MAARRSWERSPTDPNRQISRFGRYSRSVSRMACILTSLWAKSSTTVQKGRASTSSTRPGMAAFAKARAAVGRSFLLYKKDSGRIIC